MLTRQRLLPCLRVILLLLIQILFYFFAHSQSHIWTGTNPGGGGAFTTAKIGPTGQIIVGSDMGGAYASWDEGKTWETYGARQGLYQTHVSAIGFHPLEESLFFLGTKDGIYRTDDGGNSFCKVFPDGYIEDIVVAPSQPSTVYATFHTPVNSAHGFVYKSEDNGWNWRKVSKDLPRELRLLKLLISPENENLLYVLSGKGKYVCTEAEVYKSTNGGKNWEHVSDSLGPVLDIALAPTDPDVLFLTTMNASCKELDYWKDLSGILYKSTNRGKTWIPLSTRTGIILPDPPNPNEVRLVDPREPYAWNPTHGTWQSHGAGATWTQVGGLENFEKGYLTEYPDVYGPSSFGICKSVGLSLYNVQSACWVNGQSVFATYDGGQSFRVMHTRQVGPDSWKSNGIDNVLMYDLEISEANPQVLYAGYRTLGTWRSLDQGQSWESCNSSLYTGSWEGNGGNTLAIISDPDREGMVWVATQGKEGEPIHVIKSSAYGFIDSWVPSDEGLPGNSVQITGFSLDRNSPKNQRTLFLTADGNVYKSQDGGGNWSQVLKNGGLRKTAVDFYRGKIVYAGGENGLFRSRDGGNFWEALDAPYFTINGKGSSSLTEGIGISQIMPDPGVSGTVYVVVTGKGKGLFKSIDEGETWQHVLEDDFLRAVAISWSDENKIYAGSSSSYMDGTYHPRSRGILYSEDGGENWFEVNENMPYPFALTLDISRESEEVVFVGSPGTGFQYAKVPSQTLALTPILEESVHVFPSPFVESIFVEGLPKTCQSKVLMYNLQGELVWEKKGIHEQVELNTDSFGSGVYFLKISFGEDENNSLYKLIKE